MTNKLQLFEGTTIRTIWDSKTEEWYFSVADVCNVLSGSRSKDPNAYWRKLKQRLKAEGSEVVTNCHGLKLEAADGRESNDCKRRRLSCT
ncbi:MAG: hypothetical protein K6A36_03800 [Paludibacteraceae bacterium]|nr:hypothetical protein [Paludibacteraceae bacterium]